jgi:hypothetical protein
VTEAFCFVLRIQSLEIGRAYEKRFAQVNRFKVDVRWDAHPFWRMAVKNAVTAACCAALDPNSEPDATALIGMI